MSGPRRRAGGGVDGPEHGCASRCGRLVALHDVRPAVALAQTAVQRSGGRGAPKLLAHAHGDGDGRFGLGSKVPHLVARAGVATRGVATLLGGAAVPLSVQPEQWAEGAPLKPAHN